MLYTPDKVFKKKGGYYGDERYVKSYSFHVKARFPVEEQITLVIWVIDDLGKAKTFLGEEGANNLGGLQRQQDGSGIPYKLDGNKSITVSFFNLPKTNPKNETPLTDNSFQDFIVNKGPDEPNMNFEPLSYYALQDRYDKGEEKVGTKPTSLDSYIDYTLSTAEFIYKNAIYQIRLSSESDLPNFKLAENEVKFTQSPTGEGQTPEGQTPDSGTQSVTESKPIANGTYTFGVQKKGFFVISGQPELKLATEEDLKNFQKTDLELVDQEYIETPYQGGEEVYIENPITGAFVPSETKQKISEIKGVSQENVPDELSTDTKSKYVVSKDKEKNVQAIIKACKENGVTNEFAITGILSIVSKESAFVPKNEASYKTTPGERIIKIFGARGKTATQWDEIKKDDKQFFDIVYGPTPPAKTKYGNGPDEGYKYRGRGFNQITFKGNYEKYAKLTGLDLVNDPDLLNTIEAAAKCVVLYFKSGVNGAPKFAKTQYNFTDINSFKNLQDAVGACYHANAGFGNSMEHILADVTGGRAKAFKNSTPLYNTYQNDLA